MRFSISAVSELCSRGTEMAVVIPSVRQYDSARVGVTPVGDMVSMPESAANMIGW